jgi:hypothetical protein
MSDSSTRWQRVVSQSEDKPRFQARQTTGDMPRHKSSRRPREHHRRRGSSAARLWMIGVVTLASLASILAWLVFFT